MALLTSPVHPTASNGRVSLQQMRLDAKILCREEAAIGRKLSRNAALDEVSKKNGYASWHHATCHAEVKQSHSTANDAKTTEVVSIERATRVAKIGKSLSKFLEDVCNSNEIVFDGLHYCRITGGYNRSKSFAFACGRVAFMFYLGT